ncbi:hypothetical protein [Parasphingorhabdus pacifica]
MNAYEADGWSDFGVAVAGAGAALAGLLFVVLSINLTNILAGKHLTARSAHTMILLAVPLVISLLILVPGQDRRALGTELIAAGLITSVWLATLNRPSERSTEQRFTGWLITGAVPAAVLSTSTLLAGVGTITETIGGLYWIPLGVITAFVGALLNIWVLLVEILR